MPEKELGKVTAFITRQVDDRQQLLLFQHPYGGVQFPAGTMEPGETPEEAARREAWEETGLKQVTILQRLGERLENPPQGERVVIERTTVYGRPDVQSFDWAYLPRGAQVRVLRQVPGWTQITYEEVDRWPDPTYFTMVITGWVPNQALTSQRRRQFFLLSCDAETADRWTQHADWHEFELFWANADELPEIVTGPQAEWLPMLPRL